MVKIGCQENCTALQKTSSGIVGSFTRGAKLQISRTSGPCKTFSIILPTSIIIDACVPVFALQTYSTINPFSQWYSSADA